MNPLYQAALEVQEFLRERKWPFCIIGGLAVERWGQPRTTQDVDITLFTGFGSEEEYVREVLSRFAPRIEDAHRFALENRVLLARASNGVALDIALGGIPFEEQAVTRATPFQFAPGVSLITCSAEDFVVLKAFAARDQDWLDIEGVLLRQAGRLDWKYVVEQLKPLCELKGEPEIVTRLHHLRGKTEEG